MADSEDQLTLKKRARRRLVGAVALLIFIVIALPMVFDKDSKPLSRDISVQIPNPDSSEFQHKMVPTPPSVPASLPGASATTAAAGTLPSPPAVGPTATPSAPILQAPVTAPTVPKAVPAQPKAAPVQPKPVTPTATDNTKSPPAPAANASPPAPVASSKPAPQGAWMVKLGTYSEAGNAKRFEAKLTSAKIKFHADPVDTDKGTVTRFWAGPYADRAAAEKARDKIRKSGFPDAVAAEK
jgi:DedD protein